jgi:hypothetical protein
MAHPRIDASTLRAEIERLADLDLAGLRQRWRELYGTPAPKFFRRNFLIRAVAYQMQVEVFGGLKPATKRKLRQIVEAIRNGHDDALLASPRIKPGTRLMRAWQGKTHTVTVLEDGFEWQGSRMGSLSEIARAITGTRWNGLVFFGVKQPLAGKKKPVETGEGAHG